MPTPPISECPDIDEVKTTDHAAHLIVRLKGDWTTAREATTAEVEHRTRAAADYARSPAFATRYSPRIGVVRVQSAEPAPSIVSHLLSEQGIELEVLSAERPADGPSCSFCGRERLNPEQASITDSGWACPSCLRAWNVKAQPELLKKPRQLRIPPQLLWPIIIFVTLLFGIGVYYELGRLNKMNRIIRQHVPE
jgi:hypothetical protein